MIQVIGVRKGLLRFGVQQFGVQGLLFFSSISRALPSLSFGSQSKGTLNPKP